MAKTVELYFDGIKYTCEQQEDRNGEYLFVAENGRFAKFPADADLDEAVKLHNEANNQEVEIVEEKVYENVITFDKDGNEIK
jgi:hypothetical protein